MGHVDEGAPGESRLERARRAAGRVLDQLGPGSEAMIVSSSGAVVGPTGSIDHVMERLDGVEATELAGDVPAAAAVAAREIGGSGLSRREVVVFSDLDGTSWPGVKNVSAVARRGGQVRVIVFDVVSVVEAGKRILTTDR